MERYQSVVGFVLFVAAIAAHQLFGIHAFIRVVGISCMLVGVFWSAQRKIPVGIEDQPPSFHVRGLSALILGVLMLASGACLLLFAPLAACVLGWSNTSC